MSPGQLSAYLDAKAKELQNYADNVWPRMAGRKILRFIDGNFRAQGWQGSVFTPWPPNKRGGTILIKTGAGRRSFRQEIRPGVVTTWNTKPYMSVHNRGFRGRVKVGAHARNKFTAAKIGTGRFTASGKERTKTIHKLTGSIQVKAYYRNMNIPKRQFSPEHSITESPILFNAIQRQTIIDIQNMFK
jgi:hypothetical protein